MIDGAFLASALRSATPIYYAALGGVLSERAGVLNIGLEGLMLVGAVTGTTVAAKTGNVWLGVGAALVSGVAAGMLLALFLVYLRGEQIVVGITFNLLALGASTFVREWAFGVGSAPNAAVTPNFPSWRIPFLEHVPWVGEVFGKQNPLALLILVLAPLAATFLYFTGPGLAIRMVGEQARGADTLGINVQRVRFWTVTLGSGLAAVGGAYLSLAEVRMFITNITAGRGYIALAAIILGRWHPLWALGAVLVFGTSEALQFRMQAAGLGRTIPQLPMMLPYLITLLMMLLFYRRIQPPAEDGKPYFRE